MAYPRHETPQGQSVAKHDILLRNILFENTMSSFWEHKNVQYQYFNITSIFFMFVIVFLFSEALFEMVQ